MLTPQQIESLSLTTEELMQPVTEFLIDDIARRVSEAGQFTSSAAYQIWRAQALGVDRKTIEKELQKKLNVSNAEVKKLLKQSAEVGYNFDMKGFGEKAIPFSENKSLQQIIEAALKMSNNTFKNLTQTIGFVDPYGNAKGLTEAYQSSCDFAFNQVVTGATDYNTAIRNATKNLADKGIVSIDYASGVHTSLEAAVRRNIMGGLGLMQEQISQQNHDAFGADGWEISAHSASAPDHEDIQGKQYTDEEFEALNNSLTRRIGTLNCGHAAFPIILGVSEPQYTEKQLKQFKEENKKGVTYNGKHYTTYEATQKQRQIERAIRRQKRRVMVAKGSNDKDAQLISKAKLRRLNEEYERFSKSVELPLQRERLFVGKTGVVDMKPHGNNPIYNKAAKATVKKDPYEGLTVEQKKDLISANSAKMLELSEQKKKATLDMLTASSDDDITKYYNEANAIQKQLDDIAAENKVIQKQIDEMNAEAEKLKSAALKERAKNHRSVNGSDLSGKIDYSDTEKGLDIETALHAQGFDGVPKVVEYDEFVEAMNKSNFYAERTYTASSQEVLDAYRDELYNGKWYVDCSEGGSQYGKGMYCAASYDVTDAKSMGGIGWEMSHYQKIGIEKGNSFAYTEAITLEPDARIFELPHNVKTGEYIPSQYTNHYLLTHTTGTEHTAVEEFIEARKKVEEAYATRQLDNINSLYDAEDTARAKIPKELFKEADEAMKYYPEGFEKYGKYKDEGTLVAEMGYDAINAVGHGESGSYTVILNRTKVIFNKGGSIYGN